MILGRMAMIAMMTMIGTYLVSGQLILGVF
jgi:hypothetical protein